MSDKGDNSRRQEGSGESGLLGQLGREMVDNPFLVRQDTDGWEPYVGPRGGEGWKNPETGEVVYGDLGDVAEVDESVSDPQSSGQSAGYSGELQSVDHDDVDEGQYISIDGGEAEGYLNSVDRLGGDVHVTLDDGSSFWLEDGMQVAVDDDPGEVEQHQYQDTFENVSENVPIEDRVGLLSADEVKEDMIEDFSRIKSDQVFENTTDHINEVKERAGSSFYNKDSGNVVLGEDALDDTLSHELGHAIMGANGYDLNPCGNILATLHNSTSGRMRVDHIGKNLMDVVREENARGNLSDSYVQYTEENIDNPEDIVLDKEYLEMTIDEDHNEELRGLVEEVNNALSDMLDALAAEDPRAYEVEDDPMFGRPDKSALFAGEYAASNSQEVFAALHEQMQMGGVDPNSLERLYTEHPGLVAEYIDNFEPGDLQKEQINRLYQSEGSIGGIEDVPFPEVDS